MSKMLKKLTKVHLNLIHSLVTEKGDVDAILKRQGVRNCTFRRWLDDDRFFAEFEKRVISQSEMLINRNRPIAAKRLGELIDSAREETSRKACMDVIGLARVGGERSVDSGEAGGGVQLSAGMASKLLATLADSEEVTVE